MKSLVISLVVLGAISPSAFGQKVETEKANPNRIVHVQTALNHLTVIEVGEPVTGVAAGSDMFKIEWRENKVFVQPTEPGVSTNLFIWTASGRFNYELEPAGAIEQMDFAIDQPSSRASQPASTPTRATKPVGAAALLGGRPVRGEEVKGAKHRVAVVLKDVFERDNRVFIRYALRNDSAHSYDCGVPKAFTLKVHGSSQLRRLSNSQLSEVKAARLASDGVRPVEVLESEVRALRVGPGEETVGVVALELPALSDATVLRLMFPPDHARPVNATLVL